MNQQAYIVYKFYSIVIKNIINSIQMLKYFIFIK